MCIIAHHPSNLSVRKWSPVGQTQKEQTLTRTNFLPFTLPKTHSSPLKIGRGTQKEGIDRLLTIHFQVYLTVSFREGKHPNLNLNFFGPFWNLGGSPGSQTTGTFPGFLLKSTHFGIYENLGKTSRPGDSSHWSHSPCVLLAAFEGNFLSQAPVSYSYCLLIQRSEYKFSPFYGYLGALFFTHWKCVTARFLNEMIGELYTWQNRD